MGRKRDGNVGGKPCKCDKCNAEANSIPGTMHRRCSGNPDAAIRAKHDALPSANKGRWA